MHCQSCDEDLADSAFTFDKTKNKLHWRCKTCQRVYSKQHYYANRPAYLERRKRTQKDERQERRAWLAGIKSKLQCAECDQNHPAALDFHHEDPSEKDIEVANAMRKGWSKARILREIAKCIVLCASCHRIKHWDLDHHADQA